MDILRLKSSLGKCVVLYLLDRLKVLFLGFGLFEQKSMEFFNFTLSNLISILRNYLSFSLMFYSFGNCEGFRLAFFHKKDSTAKSKTVITQNITQNNALHELSPEAGKPLSKRYLLSVYC